MKKKTAVFLLILILFAMLNLVQFTLASAQPASIRSLVREGELVPLGEDEEYRGQITGFYVGDDSLIVLFGKNGIIKKYDLDGNYLSSFAFTNYGGSVALLTKGETAFLKDSEGNLYTLSEQNFGQFTSSALASALLRNLESVSDRQITTNGTFYKKLVSVYVDSPSVGGKAVVNRPLYAITGLPSFFLAVYWVIFAAGFAVVLLPKLKKHEEEKKE